MTQSSVPQPLTAKRLLQACGPASELAQRLIPQLSLQENAKDLDAIRAYYALIATLMAETIVSQTHCDRDTLPTTSQSFDATTPSLPPNEISLLSDQLAAFDLFAVNLGTPVDLLKPLYHQLVPREARHAGGEYYTPTWLAEHLLDMLDYPRADATRLLDPACGSGTFVIGAIHRLRVRCREQGMASAETLNHVLASVVGIDLDPLAVIAARANYLLAIADLLPSATAPITIPIYRGDSILDSFDELGRFDCIAGNPPWVGWETLSPEYRQTTRSLWEHYGLFAHSGMSTILGGGKKDLSMLMSYAATDRFLVDGGRLGFVITQSVFKSLSAGKGFRQFRWGADPPTLFDGETHVQVERVDDLTDFQPFENAGTRTALFVWRKGSPTEYPLPYHVWQKTTRGKSIADDATLAEAKSQTRQLKFAARPMDAADPTSCWLTSPPELIDPLRTLCRRSPYKAHEGANTGGANAIYWLEVLDQTANGRSRVRNLIAGAKKPVAEIETQIETELLHPLLRGREVRRWQGEPSAMLLMVQDPEQRRGYDEPQFATDFPLAHAYLKSFEPHLRQRAAFTRYFVRGKGNDTRETGPFYSMFNIGPATFAEWKVVWHRMVSPIGAVVVGSTGGKPILPQETHAFVACESEQEAFYLAGLMNSTPFNYAAMSFSQSGGKSFGSPQLLQQLHLPKFDTSDESQRQVVELSRECHQLAGQAPACRSQATLLTDLDQAAANVWQLNDTAAEAIAQAYAQLTKAD